VKRALHVAPQSIPAGLLVTVPAPVPAFVTVSWLPAEKLTVTVVSPVIVKVQVVPLPEHPAPLQLEIE
jgi:hypothetical protein